MASVNLDKGSYPSHNQPRLQYAAQRLKEDPSAGGPPSPETGCDAQPLLHVADELQQSLIRVGSLVESLKASIFGELLNKGECSPSGPGSLEGTIFESRAKAIAVENAICDILNRIGTHQTRERLP